VCVDCKSLGIAGHPGPFAEAEVGGDDDAGALVLSTWKRSAPPDELNGRHRNSFRMTRVETQEALGKLTGLVPGLFLFQRIDQIDGGEEADLLAVMLDGLHTERGGNVRLAGSRRISTSSTSN
jgi:hypothetical protein